MWGRGRRLFAFHNEWITCFFHDIFVAWLNRKGTICCACGKTQSTTQPNYFEIKLLTSVAVLLFLPSRGHAQRKTKTVKKQIKHWCRYYTAVYTADGDCDICCPQKQHNFMISLCHIISTQRPTAVVHLAAFPAFACNSGPVHSRAELSPLTKLGHMCIMSYLRVMCCIQLQVSNSWKKSFLKCYLKDRSL